MTFHCITVVCEPSDDDESFDLIFNLDTLCSLYGVNFKDDKQSYSCLEFINGGKYYALWEINELLDKLGIEYDEDDDDDEDEDIDDPPIITSDEFDKMLRQ